jgi:hypothetical protein
VTLEPVTFSRSRGYVLQEGISQMKRKPYPEDTDPAFAQALEERRAEQQRTFDHAVREITHARRTQEKRDNVRRRVKEITDRVNYEVATRETPQQRASRLRFRSMVLLEEIESLLTKSRFERRAYELEDAWRIERGLPPKWSR